MVFEAPRPPTQREPLLPAGMGLSSDFDMTCDDLVVKLLRSFEELLTGLKLGKCQTHKHFHKIAIKEGHCKYSKILPLEIDPVSLLKKHISPTVESLRFLQQYR